MATESLHSTDAVVARLEALRPTIRDEYNVELLGLFGSRARGDNRPDSDVDVAYRWASDKVGSLLDLGGIWSDLNTAFGVEVSLVDWEHARASFKERASQDMILLG